MTYEKENATNPGNQSKQQPNQQQRPPEKTKTEEKKKEVNSDVRSPGQNLFPKDQRV